MTSALLAVSLPQHPTTNNHFRAANEEAALAMSIGIGGELEIVHVSRRDSSGELQVYAGLGATRLTWVKSDNKLEALAGIVAERRPDLIVTGGRSLQGQGSGTLAYRLAARLGLPVLAGTRNITGQPGNWVVETGLPRGRRLRWHAAGRLVLTVDTATHAPLLQRYSETRNAQIDILEVPAASRDEGRLVPAARRPVPLLPPEQGNYAERIRSILGSPEDGTDRRIVNGTPGELAEVLVNELRRRKPSAPNAVTAALAAAGSPQGNAAGPGDP